MQGSCNKYRYAVSFFLLLYCGQLFAREPLYITHSPSPISQYATGLFKIVVDHTGDQYEAIPVDINASYARVIEEVSKGRLTVMWAAHHWEKEEKENIRPIRIPVFKGLLGYRIFIISREKQKLFNQITNKKELAKLTFGQGLEWADTTILEENGLSVITLKNYRQLFAMVNAGRFDVLPRGVIEPWEELKSYPELDLAVEKTLALHYTLPFYFYVNAKNTKLAEDLKRGLEAAVANGSYENYFQNHPIVQDALEKTNLKNRKIFKLRNPMLNDKAPLNRPEYWYKPGKNTP